MTAREAVAAMERRRLESAVEVITHQPVPRSQWPAWALALEKSRLPEDRGIGHTLEHAVGLMGSPAFEAWYRTAIGHGIPCPNCPALWNRLFAYAEPAVKG